MAAVSHGADAVYIGADRFGARAAVGNSVADIQALCAYAHPYGVKVYVTVNTLIYDAELEATRQLIWQLYRVGVDAILVQDMGILQLDLPPIALHASTQTDNRSADKVRWLLSQGFSRTVLARELSLTEISAIHREVPDMELEAFVHGALCVSYSGQCYASQHCFGRSANRGECAQFCRMKFSLEDSRGDTLVADRYLLSLKDLNQSERLEQLAEAGVTSFKIEGRLKDVAYVKNVTVAYSEKLNSLVRKHPERYQRASAGTCSYTFTPNLSKTFNRGYTHYFLEGRQPDIASFDTPKAMGEFVGTVKELRRDSFNVAGLASFANGDGLCFLGADGQLHGFRVNRVEGNRLFPHQMPRGLHAGQRLYRNNDQEFERLLSRPSAERKIPLRLRLDTTPDGFSLSVVGTSVVVPLSIEHQQADKPQRENIVRQLSKLGGTAYECTAVDVADDFAWFIPSSRLAALRRQLVEALDRSGSVAAPAEAHRPAIPPSATPAVQPVPPVSASGQPHLYNVSNRLSAAFYARQGIAVADRSAYELAPRPGALLMQCRHCLRYSLGGCVKHGGQRPTWREPLYLRLGDGRRFRLEFDCYNCQMNLYAPTH